MNFVKVVWEPAQQVIFVTRLNLVTSREMVQIVDALLHTSN